MLSIIGGSGLTQLANLEITHRQVIRTPFGEPSGALTMGPAFERGNYLFGAARLRPYHPAARSELPRQYLGDPLARGQGPGVGGLGRGIHADLKPGTIVIPDQIIDYTHGRKTTFREGKGQPGGAHGFHRTLLPKNARAVLARR